MIERRQFLTRTALLTGTVVFVSARPILAAEDRPPIAPEMVGQFVGKSHFDRETVKALLEKEPALINAAWDWGNGDWETGLGAASHVGQPDIANMILDAGARIDIFAATMLGYQRVVKAFLDDIPSIHGVPGPHAIPLLSHAIAGRDASAELVPLLIERGADVNASSRIGMTPLMMAASIGRIDAIDLLLAKGADPHVADTESQTALDWAVKRERTAAIERLKSAMAKS